MTNKPFPIPFLLIVCISLLLVSVAKARTLVADSTPVTADAKAIVSNYITAIGGMDAIKKINSTNATGNISVQGMQLPVTQKKMVPNKMLQLVAMNGTTVAKTVFNGTKGYQEQMGNRMDMSAEDIAEQKMQTTIIPQVDYLSNNAYKLSVLGKEKVSDADAYKVLVTSPAGKADTEYYDVATKLLVEQTLTKNLNGQDVNITNTFGDYRKSGDILFPYKQGLAINAGAINQSLDITLSDIKINEGVADADFE